MHVFQYLPSLFRASTRLKACSGGMMAQGMVHKTTVAVHKAKGGALSCSCEMGQKWPAELQGSPLKQRETDESARCNTELEWASWRVNTVYLRWVCKILGLGEWVCGVATDGTMSVFSDLRDDRWGACDKNIPCQSLDSIHFTRSPCLPHHDVLGVSRDGALRQLPFNHPLVNIQGSI